MNLPQLDNPPPPKGKRGVRLSVYGNVNAYVAGKFWKTLGTRDSFEIEARKAAWLNGEDNA